MTLQEQRIRIDHMRERNDPPEQPQELRWCEHCGVDLPEDGLTPVYRIPGMAECYCARCFPAAAKEFCRL